MILNLTDAAKLWLPIDLVPVTESYSEEQYPDGKFSFSGDGFTLEFSDSNTFFASEEIIDKTIGELLGTVEYVSPLHIIAYGDQGFQITGSAFDERFYSSAGDDVIRGGAGEDQIFAGLEALDQPSRLFDGNDIVHAGDGADLMVAGSGSDAYVFKDADGAFADRIERFSAQDMILVEVAFFDSNGDGRITYGGNRKFDFDNGGTLVITSAADNPVRALELDGQVIWEGVSYYVYSLVGSTGTMALAQDHVV